MENVKKVKVRRIFEDDFKEEIVKMLNSGKNVRELSESFGIGENILYRWKTNQNMKKKAKTTEEQSSYTLKLIADNERLKKDNARLSEECIILKKAVTLFTTSN